MIKDLTMRAFLLQIRCVLWKTKKVINSSGEMKLQNIVLATTIRNVWWILLNKSDAAFCAQIVFTIVFSQKLHQIFDFVLNTPLHQIQKAIFKCQKFQYCYVSLTVYALPLSRLDLLVL